MLRVYDEELPSRLMLGTAQYPSPDVMAQAVRAAEPGLVTVSLRREAAGERAGQRFWEIVRRTGVRVLPNTAGCHTARDALTTAQMAREVFDTSWIKLEVIGDNELLAPEVFGLVDAARMLVADGFKVFPYTTEDLSVAEALLRAGCEVLMPWAAPIGSALGLNNRHGLRAMRACFPEVPMVVDAGLGVPSHAAEAMELGFDAVLVNSAVSQAGDPVAMARAFRMAVEAGAIARLADPMEPRDMAVPSTPVLGRAFT